MTPQGFQSLFEFPEICSDCYLKYDPKHEFEVIPTNGGVMEHHYLYADLILNLNQRNYLKRHLSKLYLWLEKEVDNRHIILFVDPLFLSFHRHEISLFCERNSVILLSLVRCNLEVLMIFP